VNGVERLARKRQELVVLRDRLGLAPNGDDRSDVPVDAREHLALSGLTAGALACGGEASFAQDAACLLEIAVGFDERALALHHARAGLVAELLDLRRGDRGSAHSAGTSS
jgi:hypothetical protein